MWNQSFPRNISAILMQCNSIISASLACKREEIGGIKRVGGVSESKLVIPSNVKVEPRREKERNLLTVLSRTSGRASEQLRPEAEVNLWPRVAHLRERAVVVNKPSTRLDQTWTGYTGLAFSCGCRRNCGSLVRSAIGITRMNGCRVRTISVLSQNR